MDSLSARHWIGNDRGSELRSQTPPEPEPEPEESTDERVYSQGSDGVPPNEVEVRCLKLSN